MTRIITSICSLLLLAMFCACSFGENVTTTIRPKPTLRVQFDPGVQVSDNSLTVYAYVFDNQGVFVDSTVQITGANNTFDLLSGIAQKQYKVVCFGADEPILLAPLTPGKSTIEELMCSITSDRVGAQAPCLMYSNCDFEVMRQDEIITNVVPLERLYYDIDFAIEGLDLITWEGNEPLSSYYATFSELATAYDGLGVSLSGVGTYGAKLRNVDGCLVDNFRIFRPVGGQFHLCLGNGKQVFVDARLIIDPASVALDKPLKIRVRMLLSDILVTVNDWELLIPNVPGLGE
ncbi:MAG: hypothetical protein RSA94_02295 [Mucinivorans sp.]